VSHSTPEAEIVAADWALRREGTRMLDLWDILAGKGQKVVFHDDNESMIKICKSGRNPTMRHLLRSHGVAVAWLKEQFDSGNYDLRYVPFAHQAADIYTKGFDNAEKWNSVRRLIGLYAPDEVDVSKIIAFWSSVEAAAIPVPKDKASDDKGDGLPATGGYSTSKAEEDTSNSSSVAGGTTSDKTRVRHTSANVRRQSVPIPTAPVMSSDVNTTGTSPVQRRRGGLPPPHRKHTFRAFFLKFVAHHPHLLEKLVIVNSRIA